MIITSPCSRPQKQKQAKTMTTQTLKHTSTNRPTIARNTNQTKKKGKKKQTNKQ